MTCQQVVNIVVDMLQLMVIEVTHQISGIPPVLVHGDMWVGNLLWEWSSNGKAGNRVLAIIDWQICHAGTCCEDIARLLATSCSGEMRRAKTEEILIFYYEKLTQHMKGDTVPFSFQQVKEVYNRMLPCGMMFLLLGIPFWIKGSAIKGENTEYIAQKVKDAKMIIEEVIELEENNKIKH